MKDTESVDDFALKMKTVTNEIRLLGEKFEESNAARKFLQVDPSKYLKIASDIEQFVHLKTITMEEVTGRLKAHEERLRRSSDEKDDGQLLMTRSEWIAREQGRDKSMTQCWNCKKFGHFRRDCPKLKKELKEKANLNLGYIEDESALF
jgi:hypothetical protein